MNSKANILTNLFAIAGLAVSASAFAANAAEPVTVEKLETVSATVEAIDMKTRMVTLRGPEGNVATIEVRPEVRNLAQVKVGDKLVVKYYQSMAAMIKPKGSAPSTGTQQAVGGARAAEGEKPGAMVGNVVTTTVTIQAVDKKTNTVTFTAPDGIVRMREVKDPAAQKFAATLKKGDQVDLTYTEAVAASVETAK